MYKALPEGIDLLSDRPWIIHDNTPHSGEAGFAVEARLIHEKVNGIKRQPLMHGERIASRHFAVTRLSLPDQAR